MRLVVGGTVREGRVVDARDLDVTGADVAAAVRGDDASLTVETSDSRPVHERVGYVHLAVCVSRRAALAAAARSRGHEAPQDERLTAIRDELSDLSAPEASTRAARRAVAKRTGEVERLDERVSTLRGRVQALRERDVATDEAEGTLRATTRELTEARTALIAARERLEAAETAAREARDARERRMELEDRLANRRREARAHLAETMEPAFRAAVDAAPWERHVDPFAVDDVTAALAVGRFADLRAPVVLACDRFADPAAAADWLDAPVLRL